MQNDESTYGFETPSKPACKHLWKCCVEHHAFFRLVQVSPATPDIFALGSRFRYRYVQTQHVKNPDVFYGITTFLARLYAVWTFGLCLWFRNSVFLFHSPGHPGRHSAYKADHQSNRYIGNPLHLYSRCNMLQFITDNSTIPRSFPCCSFQHCHFYLLPSFLYSPFMIIFILQHCNRNSVLK